MATFSQVSEHPRRGVDGHRLCTPACHGHGVIAGAAADLQDRVVGFKNGSQKAEYYLFLPRAEAPADRSSPEVPFEDVRVPSCLIRPEPHSGKKVFHLCPLWRRDLCGLTLYHTGLYVIHKLPSR